MPLSRPIALTLALAAGLAAFVATAGCDAARTAPAGRGLKTGHFDLSPEARRLLPRGAVLYYGKHDRSSIADRWAIEQLDVDTGRTQEILSTDSSGLISLQPYSISPDNRYLLFSAWRKTPKRIETLLAELDLRSGTWRKIMNSAISGYYSPDGSMIALYTSQGNVQNSAVHRVYITNRFGKILHEVPCDSSSCYHPYWNPKGDSILYIEGNNKIYSYSILSKSRHKIYEDHRLHHIEIHYPIYCNGEIVYFVYEKTKRYSKTLGYRTSHSQLHSLMPGSLVPRSLGDATDIAALACPRMLSKAIAVHDTPGQGLHLAIIQLQTKRMTRLIPPKPSRTTYMDPVLAIRR